MGTESLSAMAMSTKAMSERYVALRRLPSPVPSPTPNQRRVSIVRVCSSRGTSDVWFGKRKQVNLVFPSHSPLLFFSIR